MRTFVELREIAPVGSIFEGAPRGAECYVDLFARVEELIGDTCEQAGRVLCPQARHVGGEAPGVGLLLDIAQTEAANGSLRHRDLL